LGAEGELGVGVGASAEGGCGGRIGRGLGRGGQVGDLALLRFWGGLGCCF